MGSLFNAMQQTLSLPVNDICEIPVLAVLEIACESALVELDILSRRVVAERHSLWGLA